ncbi:hypothetical protein RU97_GL002547 [Enterococcus canis]|uniref:Uncharacterized protein n=1 Tax=Enterococcus canis TaxID=214095 RepID=A0A1L8RCM8_9ENTE|nr:hypothetical protein [Enterococcus canis]OJG17539.1 hypothetical protein RU97_GL002547 [Enterococcus canis]
MLEELFLLLVEPPFEDFLLPPLLVELLELFDGVFLEVLFLFSDT